MKFPRPSFSKENGERPDAPAMHFKMPSLRHKQSKATFSDSVEQVPADRMEKADKVSRRKTVQQFFKSTGANMKATGDKLPMRSMTRKHKMVCVSVLSPEAQRTAQLRSFAGEATFEAQQSCPDVRYQ